MTPTSPTEDNAPAAASQRGTGGPKTPPRTAELLPPRVAGSKRPRHHASLSPTPQRLASQEISLDWAQPVLFRAEAKDNSIKTQSKAGAEILSAYEVRAQQVRETGRILAELGDIVEQKLAQIKKTGLADLAQSLTSDINSAIQIHCQQLAGNCPTNQPTKPSASWATAVASAKKNAGNAGITTTTTTTASAPQAAPRASLDRLFIRLPEAHPDRQASSFFALQKLRKLLPLIDIKEVQKVPSGLAIVPKTTTAAAALKLAKDKIQAAFNNSTVEENTNWLWARAIDLPTTLQDLSGNQIPVTEEMARTELQIQTDLQLERARWSKQTTDEKSYAGTLVFAYKSRPETTLPGRISLFGASVRLIPSKHKAQVRQCTKCWGYHNERTCLRRVRCRTCGSTQHSEDSHNNDSDGSIPRCFNCRGPHRADDPGCPARPKAKDGIVQRKTRTELEAIRKTQGVARAALTAMKDQQTRPPPSSASGTSSPPSSLASQPSTQMTTDSEYPAPLHWPKPKTPGPHA